MNGSVFHRSRTNKRGLGLLAAVLMLLPFFGQTMMAKLKGAFSVMLALLLFPAVGVGVEAPALNLYYAVLAAQEVRAVLVVGAVVSVTAYRIMVRLGRLPVDARVLS